MARILFLLSLAALVFACFACADDDDDDNDDASDDDNDNNDDDDDDDTDDDLDDDLDDDTVDPTPNMTVAYLDGGDLGFNQYWFAVAPDGAAHLASLHSAAMVLSSKAADEEEWTRQTHDLFVQHPAIAVDADGHTHLVYLLADGQHLVYATDRSGQWQATKIGSTAEFIMPLLVAADGAGRGHVAYLDAAGDDNPTVKYVVIDGETVTKQSVAKCIGFPMSLSMAVTPDGTAHLTFYDPEERLIYADNADGEWAFSTVASQYDAGGTSLAVDENGVVHIVYQDVLDLTWATRNGSLWEKRSLELNGTYFGAYQPRLAAGPDGRFVLLYIEYWEDPKEATKGWCTLKMYHNLDSDWTVEEVDPISEQIIIIPPAFDEDGNVHFVEYDGQTIIYRTNRGGSWQSETVEEKGEVLGAIAKTHADGTPELVYIKQYELWSADETDGQWTFTQFLSDADDTPDLAIAADDTLHLAYHDYACNKLLYAKNPGGIWRSETVIEPFWPFIGEIPSLALDSQSRPHIVMARGGSGANDGLFYHRKVGNQWLTEKVREGGSNWNNTLLLDAQDNAYIVFIDSKATDIMLADNRSGAWTFTTFDDAYSLDRSSNALWDGDALLVAYFGITEMPSMAVKLARYENNAWETQTVDTDFIFEDGLAFARDSQGYLYLLYVAASDGSLRLLHNRSGSWKAQTIALSLEEPQIHSTLIVNEQAKTVRAAFVADEALWSVTFNLDEESNGR
ncbi:MAG TPA: hypothetical protein PKW95_22160 [bacterium]|nr:hypothetical protein [bacterium]